MRTTLEETQHMLCHEVAYLRQSRLKQIQDRRNCNISGGKFRKDITTSFNYSHCNHTESSWNQISSFEQYYLCFSEVPLSEKLVLNLFLRDLTDLMRLGKDEYTNLSLQTSLKPLGSFFLPPLGVVFPYTFPQGWHDGHLLLLHGEWQLLREL